MAVLAGDVSAAQSALNYVPTLKLSDISKVGGSSAAYPLAGVSGLVHYNTAPVGPKVPTQPNIGGSLATYPLGPTGTNVNYNSAAAPQQIAAAAPKPAAPTATPASTLTAPAPNPGRPLTDDEKAAFMKSLLMGDTTLRGEIGAGQSALGEQWQGSVLTPIVQALTQYGAALPSDVMTQLNAINAPTIYDPYTDSQIPVGTSLGAYLQNPTIAAAVAAGANNPYSDFNTARRTYSMEGETGVGSALSRGLGHSSAVGNAIAQAAQDRGAALYNQAQAIMSQLTGNVTGFNTNVNSWLAQQAQDINDTQTLIAQKIAAGLIALPTYENQTAGNPTGAYAGQGDLGTGAPPIAVFPSSGAQGNVAGVPVNEAGQIVAEPTHALGAQGYLTQPTPAAAGPSAATVAAVQKMLSGSYAGATKKKPLL